MAGWELPWRITACTGKIPFPLLPAQTRGYLYRQDSLSHKVFGDTADTGLLNGGAIFRRAILEPLLESS